jgi:hypothetical protein
LLTPDLEPPSPSYQVTLGYGNNIAGQKGRNFVIVVVDEAALISHGSWNRLQPTTLTGAAMVTITSLSTDSESAVERVSRTVHRTTREPLWRRIEAATLAGDRFHRSALAMSGAAIAAERARASAAHGSAEAAEMDEALARNPAHTSFAFHRLALELLTTDPPSGDGMMSSEAATSAVQKRLVEKVNADLIRIVRSKTRLASLRGMSDDLGLQDMMRLTHAAQLAAYSVAVRSAKAGPPARAAFYAAAPWWALPVAFTPEAGEQRRRLRAEVLFHERAKEAQEMACLPPHYDHDNYEAVRAGLGESAFNRDMRGDRGDGTLEEGGVDMAPAFDGPSLDLFGLGVPDRNHPERHARYRARLSDDMPVPMVVVVIDPSEGGASSDWVLTSCAYFERAELERRGLIGNSDRGRNILQGQDVYFGLGSNMAHRARTTVQVILGMEIIQGRNAILQNLCATVVLGHIQKLRMQHRPLINAEFVIAPESNLRTSCKGLVEAIQTQTKIGYEAFATELDSGVRQLARMGIHGTMNPTAGATSLTQIMQMPPRLSFFVDRSQVAAVQREAETLHNLEAWHEMATGIYTHHSSKNLACGHLGMSLAMGNVVAVNRFCSLQRSDEDALGTLLRQLQSFKRLQLPKKTELHRAKQAVDGQATALLPSGSDKDANGNRVRYSGKNGHGSKDDTVMSLALNGYVAACLQVASENPKQAALDMQVPLADPRVQLRWRLEWSENRHDGPQQHNTQAHGFGSNANQPYQQQHHHRGVR